MRLETSLNLRNLADACSTLILGEKLAWEDIEDDKFDAFNSQIVELVAQGQRVKNTPAFVCSTESYYNCPVHDGVGMLAKWYFSSLDEMKSYALENLNDSHIEEVESLHDTCEYTFEYVIDGHSYIQVKLLKNGNIISETVQYGMGKMKWEEVS